MKKKDRLSVVMLNAPFLQRYSRGQRNPGVTRSDTMYYPYWISYTTGSVEATGANCIFLDAPGEGWDYGDVEKRIVDFGPDLIIMDTTTPSIYNDIDVLEKLKVKFPNAKFAVMGTHATATVEETMGLSRNIDYLIRGESDYTARDLTLALENGAKIEKIEGLTWRNSDAIVHNPDRPAIKDLDSLPFVSEVYKRHLNIWNYFNPDCLYPNITLLTGRGCPYNCSFCLFVHTVSGASTRYRSVENVLDELEYIEKTFPDAQAFFFEDDIFTLNEKRCVELCEGMIKRGIKLKWNANSRADVSYEALKVMKKAGCRALCVGFETGNQEIVDAYGKKLKVEDYYRFSKNARKIGLTFHGCFIVGGPGENKKTMAKTLKMAKELRPDTAQFYPLMVYPGTPEYDRMKANGMLVTTDYRDWLTKEGLHNCIIRTEDSSPEDLIRWCDSARRKFYLRPSYLWYKGRRALVDSEERKRTIKAFKVFVKYLYKGSNI
ncbi:MAG: radical SAM protein [Candidatus Marinimicrobia bacterium]|nr:radical SAM protein [Candidatus Neomarinimicrobiota bacterium]